MYHLAKVFIPINLQTQTKILGKFEMRDGSVVIYLHGYIIFWFFLSVIAPITLVVDKNTTNTNSSTTSVTHIIKGNETNTIDMLLPPPTHNTDNTDTKMNVRHLFLITILSCSVWNVMRLRVNYEHKVSYLHHTNTLVLI